MTDDEEVPRAWATAEGVEDPRFVAGLGMLRRTGVLEVDIRFQDDKEPVVWMVGGRWKLLHGKPVPASQVGTSVWDFAASLSPLGALLRLLESKIDGGSCSHCSRPTWFEGDLPGDTPIDALAQRAFCVYAWDPELATYRRGCEGG